jgi:hypothetical protein
MDGRLDSSKRKNWESLWDRFLEDSGNAAWVHKHSKAGPVYALPPAFITGVSKPIKYRGKTISVVDERDQSHERAFYQCCRDFTQTTVGVWQGYPVQHSLVIRANPLEFSDALIDAWQVANKPSLREKKHALNELGKVADFKTRQLVDYAGRLTLNPLFQSELKTLRGALAEYDKPSFFPIERQAVFEPTPGCFERHTLTAHAAFLDRWKLCRLDTWNLWTPTGSYDYIPSVTFAQLFPDAMVSNIHPQHMSVPFSNAPSAVGRFSHPAEASLDRGQALRSGNPSRYEHAYDMSYLERAFRSRYGTKKGYRAAVTGGFIEYIGCGEEAVLKLTKLYRAHLK